MLNQSEIDRVCIILVRARDPNNIGAVARAMYDFGFDDLRLVNQYPVPLERARSAIDASHVLENAVEYRSVADAVAECTLVVGTTALGPRKREHPLFSLAGAGKFIRSELTAVSPGPARVGLLFGSEKTGLSNDELSYCNWLVTIPMHSAEGMRHASMNLGQAVAVCLYELVRDEAAPSLHQPLAGAPAADLERLTGLLAEVLETSEYSRRHPANFDQILVRRLVRSMGLDRSRSLAWTGILRQILWKLRKQDSTEGP